MPGGRTLACTREQIEQDLKCGRIKGQWLVKDISTGATVTVSSLVNSTSAGCTSLGNRAVVAPGLTLPSGTPALHTPTPSAARVPIGGGGAGTTICPPAARVRSIDELKLPWGIRIHRLARFETWTVDDLGQRIPDVAGTCVGEWLDVNPARRRARIISNRKDHVVVRLVHKRPGDLPMIVRWELEWSRLGHGVGIALRTDWRRTGMQGLSRAVAIWFCFALIFLLSSPPGPVHIVSLIVLCGFFAAMGFVAVVGCAVFLFYKEYHLMPRYDDMFTNCGNQMSEHFGNTLVHRFDMTSTNIVVERDRSPPKCP